MIEQTKNQKFWNDNHQRITTLMYRKYQIQDKLSRMTTNNEDDLEYLEKLINSIEILLHEENS